MSCDLNRQNVIKGIQSKISEALDKSIFDVKGSSITITRQPINYFDEPGFRERNPNFNHTLYVNTANKFGSGSTEVAPDMKPYLTIEHINSAFKEDIIKPISSTEYYIDPSEKLINSYLREMNSEEVAEEPLVSSEVSIPYFGDLSTVIGKEKQVYESQDVSEAPNMEIEVDRLNNAYRGTDLHFMTVPDADNLNRVTIHPFSKTLLPETTLRQQVQNKFTDNEVVEATLTSVTRRLGKVVPSVVFRTITQNEAKEISNLPNIHDVKSFIKDNVVYLIDGQYNIADKVEEMLHPIVAGLRVDNPALFNQVLSSVKPLYANEHKQYAALSLDADAEVVTKALRDELGKTELTKKGLWQRIMEYIKDVLQKLFPYSANKISNAPTETTLKQLSEYLVNGGYEFKAHFMPSIQYSLKTASPATLLKKQVEFFDKLSTFPQRNGITKLADDQKIDGKRYIDKDGNPLSSITEKIKEINDDRFKDMPQTQQDKITFEMMREEGILLHGIVEDVIGRNIDKTTGLRKALDPNRNIPEGIPEKIYNIVDEYITGLMDSYEDGTRFIFEQISYNPATKLAGTIDFIAITPQAKIHILDWKFIKKPANSGEDILKDWKQSNYNIQLSSYRNAIKAATGAIDQDFEKVRIQPFIRLENKKEGLTGLLTPYRKGETATFNKQYAFISTSEHIPVTDIDSFFAKLRNFANLDAKKRNLEANVNYYTSDQELRSKIENAITEVMNTGNLENLLDLHRKLFTDAKLLEESIKQDTTGIEFIDPTNQASIYKKLILMNDMISSVDSFNVVAKFAMGEAYAKTEGNSEKEKKVKGDLLAFNRDVELLKESFRDINKDINIKAGQDYGYTNLAEEEKKIGSFTKNFTFLSQAQIRTANFFGKVIASVYPKMAIIVNEHFLNIKSKTTDLQKKASSQGKGLQDMFNMMIDAEGGKNPRLHSIYKKEFWAEQNGLLDGKDFKPVKEFFEKYYDLTELKQKNSELITRKVDEIKSSNLTEYEKQQQIDKIYNLYSFEESIRPYRSVSLKYLKNTDEFKDKYHSDFAKLIEKPENKELKDFYHMALNINKRAAEQGFIGYSEQYTFIPNMFKGMIEQNGKGGIKGYWKTFTDKFRVTPEAGIYGNVDPVNGMPIKEVFCPYTSDFFKGDYSKKSLDLAIVYGEFAKELEKAIVCKELEPFAKSLTEFEKDKKVLETTPTGLIKKLWTNKTNNLTTNSASNLEYLQMYIDSNIYGIRIQDSFDHIFTTKDGSTYSLKQMIDASINLMYQTTFGINLPSALRNSVSGFASTVFQQGRHFNTGDMANVGTVMDALFTNHEKLTHPQTVQAAILGKFLPFINTQYGRKLSELSVNKLTSWVNPDFLMALQNKSEDFVQLATAMALINNTIIVDNKMVNVNDYVRDQFPDKYKSASDENGKVDPVKLANIEKEMTDRRKELLENNAILKVAKIQDGNLVFGENVKLDDKDITKFVNLAQYYQQRATGQNPEWNTIGYRTMTLGRLAGMYKNWIPRTVQARYGKFSYNSQVDDYEWGRWLNYGNAVSSAWKDSWFKGIKTMMGFTDKEALVTYAQTQYQKFVQDSVENKRDFQEFLSEDEFIDRYLNNIKNSTKEIYVISSLAFILLSGMLAGGEGDSDEEKALKSFSRFQIDRMRDEFTFYFDPSSFTSILGNMFPQLTYMKNVLKIPIWELPKQVFGLLTGNDDIMEKAHPLKYVLKTVPVFSELAKWSTMIYPPLAKDLGIKPIDIRNL